MLLFAYHLGPGSAQKRMMQTFVIYSKEKHGPSVNLCDRAIFGVVLTIGTKQGIIQQKHIVVSRWSQLYSEMTRNNLLIPLGNAKIDIMSILRRRKQIIMSKIIV